MKATPKNKDDLAITSNLHKDENLGGLDDFDDNDNISFDLGNQQSQNSLEMNETRSDTLNGIQYYVFNINWNSDVIELVFYDDDDPSEISRNWCKTNVKSVDLKYAATIEEKLKPYMNGEARAKRQKLEMAMNKAEEQIRKDLKNEEKKNDGSNISKDDTPFTFDNTIRTAIIDNRKLLFDVTKAGTDATKFVLKQIVKKLNDKMCQTLGKALMDEFSSGIVVAFCHLFCFLFLFFFTLLGNIG